MVDSAGTQIRRTSVEALLQEGPAQTIVANLMLQMALKDSGQPFVGLFGPFTKIGDPNVRWADYQRFDWSIRQLPAISVFESGTEEKTSSNGWLNGSVGVQVIWQPAMRRSDLTRIPRAFSSALLNFLESKNAYDMFKLVPGLNTIGRETSEQKNIETIIDNELCAVSMIDVKYRVDLRSWYRHLEDVNKERLTPFIETLADFTEFKGTYVGVTGSTAAPADVQISIPVDTTFT